MRGSDELFVYFRSTAFDFTSVDFLVETSFHGCLSRASGNAGFAATVPESQPLLQSFQSPLPVLHEGSRFNGRHNDPGRQVFDPDRGRRFVLFLASRTGRSEGGDDHVFFRNLHFLSPFVELPIRFPLLLPPGNPGLSPRKMIRSQGLKFTKQLFLWASLIKSTIFNVILTW